jgi:hypothetical protein
MMTDEIIFTSANPTAGRDMPWILRTLNISVTTIRFNYSQTMRTIKDYADQAIKEYEKAELKRGR